MFWRFFDEFTCLSELKWIQAAFVGSTNASLEYDKAKLNQKR